MFEKLFCEILVTSDLNNPLSHQCVNGNIITLLTSELECGYCNFELTDEEKAILNLYDAVIEIVDIRNYPCPMQIRVSRLFIEMYNIKPFSMIRIPTIGL